MLNNTPLARIMSLVKMERKEISAVYFYAILNGIIQLSVPLGIQAIIGYVLGGSMRASLVVLIVLVVLGVFSAGMMQINQMKIIEKIQQKIFVRYSFAFASHIPRLDLRKTDAVYLPELVNRFFDIPVLQKSLAKILLDIPTASIQILFGLLLLCFYHPFFIFFGLVLLLLLWLILRYTGEDGLKTSLEESSYKYKVAGWLEETARVIKSIKLAKSHELHLQKTDNYVTGYLGGRTRHFKILLLQYNVLVIFKTIITAAMLIVGTYLLVEQQLTIGQFIAAEIVILLLLGSVEKLIMTLSNVYDTLTAVEKLAKMTDKPAESPGTLDMPEKKEGMKIDFKDVAFGYTDTETILHDVNFTLHPGEKVCIAGADGSGKSTLLRLMAGAYFGFSGSIAFDNLPVTNYTPESYRRQMGVLLYQQDIFQGSLLENITLGNASITIDEIISLAAVTGLDSFIASQSDGFETILDPAGKRLPKSIVHRILLLRALVGNPRLLLLEDPFDKMDEAHRTALTNLLLSLKNTTVVITGKPETDDSAWDTTILIEDGTTRIL